MSQKALVGWAAALFMCAACAETPSTAVSADSDVAQDGTLQPVFDLGTLDALPTTPDTGLPDVSVPARDATELDAAELDAAADAAEPDAMPSTIDPPRNVFPEQRLEGSVAFASRISDGIFAETADGALVVTSAGAVVLGPAAGTTHAVAELRRGQPLVAGAEGLFIWNGEALELSPLSAATGSVLDLFAAPGPAGRDLWIHTDDRLSIYRDGTLHHLNLGELPTDVVQISLGPWPGGLAGIWVMTHTELYALAVDGQGVTAWPSLPLEGELTAMAVDGPGAVWLVLDGVLHRRSSAGDWRAFDRLPFVPTQLSAAPDAPDLWLAAEDGTLWHERAGRFSQIIDAPAFDQIGPGAAGAVLLWGEAGLYDARPGAFLGFSGARDGVSILESTVLRLRASPEDGLQGITLSLDGAPAEPLEGPPYQWTIDPFVLGDGTHRAVFEATWQAGNTASAALRFGTLAVGPPTWQADIEPLFVDRCNTCHGDGGYAHPLFQMAQWRDDLDRILAAVTDARMPLPPAPALTPEELQLIEGWRDEGFLEQWP